MRATRRCARAWPALALALVAAGSPHVQAQTAARLDRLTLVAPGAPTGGWVRTAENMARTLRAAALVDEVRVVNRPGDSGSLALAEFVADSRGDDHVLLVGGAVMVGAAPPGSAVASNLAAVVPIARLTGESQVLAVATASSFRTLADLLRTIRDDPASLRWVGGPYGGANHTVVSLIAQATGADVLRTSYVPTHSRADMIAFVTTKPRAVGIGGYGEFAAEIAAGRMRVLGVTSPDREPGVDVPTLREHGLDVAFVNWRGVFGAPGITAAQQETMAALMAAMVAHPDWRAVLQEQYWIDLYQPPGGFRVFLEAALQAPPTAIGAPSPAPAGTGGTLLVVGGVAASALLVIGILGWVRLRQPTATGPTGAIPQASRPIQPPPDPHVPAMDLRPQPPTETIDRQFEAWSLTPAERDVAALLLRGMRHKEIADLRHTSERTVRQQALAIYRKAGLDGRTELAAHFLEGRGVPAEPAARGSRT